ncbi:hypothetical protein HanRHA438_Chr17g0798691 [Helianthus annuus]|nr:hypothetical protein HanRHA438_Chr17g0798691 [Helianthus annuus]
MENEPSEIDNTLTPSIIAASMPAKMSLPKQPDMSHVLYMAMCASGAIPHAVPFPNWNTLALSTQFPAAVLEVCVPWPASSIGVCPLTKLLIPISLLLHPATSHLPFHVDGGGGTPSSLNDGCPGVIPESITPIMVPFP